jgi:hypothetical protein
LREPDELREDEEDDDEEELRESRLGAPTPVKSMLPSPLLS